MNIFYKPPPLAIAALLIRRTPSPRTWCADDLLIWRRVPAVTWLARQLPSQTHVTPAD